MRRGEARDGPVRKRSVQRPDVNRARTRPLIAVAAVRGDGQHGDRTELGAAEMDLLSAGRVREIDGRHDRRNSKLSGPFTVGRTVPGQVESQGAQLAVGEQVGQRPPCIQVLSFAMHKDHPAFARAEDQASQNVAAGTAELNREHPRERC